MPGAGEARVSYEGGAVEELRLRLWSDDPPRIWRADFGIDVVVVVI